MPGQRQGKFVPVLKYHAIRCIACLIKHIAMKTYKGVDL